jgi:hypothetical protein
MAVFEGSVGVVVTAFASLPAGAVTVTVAACADMAPGASKPKGSAVASSGRRKELQRLILIMASSRSVTIQQSGKALALAYK